MTAKDVLARIQARGFRVKVKEHRAQCPAHGGRDLNLSVRDGRDVVLVACHSHDCPPTAIVAAVGLSLKDLRLADGPAHTAHPSWMRRDSAVPRAVTVLPIVQVPKPPHPVTPTPQPPWPAGVPYPRGRVDSEHVDYLYQRADGEPYTCVRRVERAGERKTFVQYRWVRGVWVSGVAMLSHIPYNLPAWIEAPEGARVFVTEGEKGAAALIAGGLRSVTTNREGATHWTADDARCTAGLEVVVFEDNDTQGRTRTPLVAELCRTAGARSVRVVTPQLLGFQPNGETGEDVVDWLAAGHTVAEL